MPSELRIQIALGDDRRIYRTVPPRAGSCLRIVLNIHTDLMSQHCCVLRDQNAELALGTQTD